MTEEEARQVAKLHRGITVIRKKRSWAFYAAFHTTWGHISGGTPGKACNARWNAARSLFPTSPKGRGKDE